jgi:NADH-quinone oxidoreductase E subunit
VTPPSPEPTKPAAPAKPAGSAKPAVPAKVRTLEVRDPNQPSARGTRSTGYDEAAGAPAGIWPKPTPETTATATATATAVATAAPVAAAPAAAAPNKLLAAPVPGQTVRKSAPAAPKPPTPTPFPPDSLKAECEALIARYPRRAAALLPILHLAQRHLGGWISPELEAGIAQYLGVSDQHVRGVVTFYTMFNSKPVGRHHVQVCRTLSCWLVGAGDLTRCLKEKTGLRPGETDAQGRFTVSEVECLGLCELAPALFVNDDAHTNVSREKLEKLLDGLK